MQIDFSFMDKRKVLGALGEDLVAKNLEQQGFTIQHRNYRRRYGEVDIIADKDDVLVFVEVKCRKHAYFDVSQLVPWSKQKKIIMVAKDYIARYDHAEKVCRFDVALVEGEKLTYLENAFCEEGAW